MDAIHSALFGTSVTLFTYCYDCDKQQVGVVWQEPPYPADWPTDPIGQARALWALPTSEFVKYVGWYKCTTCNGRQIVQWEPASARYRAVFGFEADYYRPSSNVQRLVGSAEQIFLICVKIHKSVHAIFQTTLVREDLSTTRFKEVFYVDIGPRHKKALDALNNDLRLSDSHKPQILIEARKNKRRKR